MATKPNQPQPVQIPMELVLNELREYNDQLSYDLILAKAQIAILQAQIEHLQAQVQAQGGEGSDGDAEPAA